MENSPITWSNANTMNANTPTRKPHKPLVNYVPADRIRRIVALRSRGNINLQRGAYSTSADIEKRREKIAKYDFSRF